MEPKIAMDHTVVAEHLHDEVVHVMVEIEAPEAPALERAPLDVVIVLDRSGSMSGAPIKAVTEATADVLRLAHPDDRIAVVTFDDDIDVALPLDHAHGDQGQAIVRAIRTGGSTNLSGGWLKALEILNGSLRDGALRRIIVLTDGHANAGISDEDALAELVGTGRQQSITTSFIGFSDGFDEDMLLKLSDAGSGNNYYCEGADQASAVFTTEFNGLASVVAQNISVEIVPTSAVAAVTPLNDFPSVALPNGGRQVTIGDAYGGEKRRLVLAFNLRPQTNHGPLDIAEITLRWTSVVGSVEMHTITIPVAITVGALGTHDAGADPRVRDEVIVLQAAQERRQARNLANSGDFDAAANLIEGVAARLRTVTGREAEVQRLTRQAADLRSRKWDQATSKTLLADSTAYMRNRTTTGFASWDDDDEES
jgi:Ca-activated chloride channel family protein